MHIHARSSLLLTALLALAPADLAGDEDQKTELPWKRGGIFVGGFLSRFESSVRLGSDSLGAGLEVNLEDAFNLESSATDWRLGGYWRFGETMRHKASLDFNSSKRTASKVTEEDITIGDSMIPACTEISAESSVGIIRAAYSYSFFLDERVDLAASFGIYAMPFDFEFTGVDTSETEDFTAPLPVIGLTIDFAITPELFLIQRANLFYLEYGDFRGGLADLYFGLEWFPWKHFGVGLGLNSFRVKVEADGEDYPGADLVGDVGYQQTGLLMYLTYAF